MFRKTLPFLLLFVLFSFSGAWLLGTYSAADLVLFVNGHYTAFLDAVMPWWTDFGDGGTHIAIIVLLIVYAWRTRRGPARWGWLGFLGFALPSLTSQVLKESFFNHVPRPVTYFTDTPSVLHHVAGVELWTYNSFPSGHTITAFSIALTLIYLFQPRRVWAWTLVLFAWALSVGYSRMYLAEHFFRDVYGGAIIGTVMTYASLWIGERTLPRRWRRPADRPLA